MCCGRKVLWEMVHLSACCMQCSIVMGKFVEQKSIHALKISQFVRHPDHYIYTENGSKNKSGGLHEVRIANETLPVCACPDLGGRCHVHLLDKYMSNTNVSVWGAGKIFSGANCPLFFEGS